MSGSHSSAGVYTTETDLSQRAQRATTSIAVIVAEADKGPVGQRTLITSEDEMVKVFGKPNPKIGFGVHSAIAFFGVGNQLYFTRVAPEAKYGGVVISWDGRFNQSTPFVTGEAEPELYAMASNELFIVYAANPGSWNNDIGIRLVPDTRTNEAYFTLEVYLNGAASPAESYRVHLNHVVDGFGAQANVQEHINRRSSLIRIVQNTEATPFVANPNARLINTFDAGDDADYPSIRFNGGDNGRRPTESEMIEAWDLYEDPEYIDINILIQAGYNSVAFQQRMDELCRLRMDCVAILDTPQEYQDVQKAVSFRRSNLLIDSSYSALYSPDLYVADKFNDIRLYLPPSGFVAAAYARTDRDFESWFAPAGMVRGALNVAGVYKVYDQGKRDALYSSQVNAIRVIEGAGIKIWGADTLQVMPSALSNMSVRRLMIVIEKTLSNALIYSVFDPNDDLLRTRLKSMCERFLQTIQDARGLYSFGVVCDETNNPAASIANGDLNVDIYVDPVLPAKRVMFTAIINRTGVHVTGGNL